MQKTIFKPVLVPTVYSLRTLLWSAVLLSFFGSLMWLYCEYGALTNGRKALAAPVQSVLETPLYKVRTPLGWERYGRDGDALAMFRKADADIPLIFFFAERNVGYPFHALDTNADIGMRIVQEDIAAAHVGGLSENMGISPVGVERLTVMPGVTAMHMLFDLEEFSGEAMIFYAGDVRYVIWAVWSDGDDVAGGEIKDFFGSLFEHFEIPEMRESIDRPVVDSGNLTAEMNSATHRQVERELALWRLFAARAEAEPEAALMPALEHYREALRLLSSIRQEYIALASEDFKRYQHLLERRRRDVDEWFVVLEKAVAMRDWPKARSQAKWIMSHATLTGERVDVRRAADILSSKIPAEDEGKKK